MGELIPKIMAEYDAMKEDGSWEGRHPIMQMAEEIDMLRGKLNSISEIVWADEIEDAYDALNAIQSYC